MSLKEYDLIVECTDDRCEGGLISHHSVGGMEGLAMLKSGMLKVKCPECEFVEKLPKVELQQ